MRGFANLIAASAIFAAGLAFVCIEDRPPNGSRPIIGNVETLRVAYEAWRAEKIADGEERTLTLPLRWSKGLSAEFTTADGEARFELRSGEVELTVRGLGELDALEAWLVAYRPGADNPVSIDARDRLVSLGRMTVGDGTASLRVALDDFELDEFELDQVVVARAGHRPREAGLLYGSPDLFERVFAREVRAARTGAWSGVGGVGLALIPSFFPAAAPQPPPFAALAFDGEQLFFEETFSGNGRTCGTCHPADNNLTLDPEFIATLPDDDPLFVAEFIPALNHTLNGGKRFENPVLMREFGLILENLDGFGSLKTRFTMRGVPHVFAQNVSITRPPGSLAPPNDRTGWSGDGAPNNGELRDFATGAVTQHFPLTTNRVDGVDFVLPTPDQLTALEAFQRTLGRQADLTLSTLQLVDSNATAGKNIFVDNNVGKCNRCHFNAGANVSFIPPAGTFNQNFNTGVEAFLVNHPDGTGEPRPVDGGFGTNPAGDFTSIAPNPDGSFGNQTFNTPSLVETADTLPAFHNNITLIPGSVLSTLGANGTTLLGDTMEGAISFYNTLEFNNSPGGAAVGGITLNATQVSQVGKFLRVINALDNEEQISKRAQSALDLLLTPGFDNVIVNRLLGIAIADCSDAIEVLAAVDLHRQARQRFHQARQKLEGAMAGPTHVRIMKIEDAIQRLKDARAEMVIE